MIAVPCESRRLTTPSLFEFPHDYPISLTSFQIPGLGKSGLKCGHKRMDSFSNDGSAVRYGILKCKRIECPTCWPDWAKRVVFNLALRIEAYAQKTNQRPFSVLMSVPPGEVENRWTWERVNRSLFQRGYRRIENHGINGGVAVFHPYRIKDRWKTNFRNSGIHRDIGMWKVVRERANNGESLFKFVKLGPHVHGIVFGKPEAHRCEDYVIRFNDGDNHVPKELSLKDIIGLLFYLISHTGVLNHKKAYKRHRNNELKIRRQLTHTIRAFGDLFRYDPHSVLSESEYNALASEIAGMIGMRWENGELGYPASNKELGISDKEIEWVPIYQLGSYLNNESWLSGLSYYQAQFWLLILTWLKEKHRPPALGEVEHPGDISVYVEDKQINVEKLAGV